MSKQKKNWRNSVNWWQSAAYNTDVAMMYEDWLFELALSRFEWEGLPSTCDARYLEWVLLSEGLATISQDSNGIWHSIMCVPQQTPNQYDNPKAWRAYGQSGTPDFACDWRNGVVIYDNMLRVPTVWKLQLFARRLMLFDRTLDENLMQQHTPWILSVDQTMKNDAVQIVKQVFGGEPAILGTPQLANVMESANVLNMGVPFIGEQLQKAQETLWSQIYTFLGIDSLSAKSERMIEDEVSSLKSPADLRRVAPLRARRVAVDKLNERFGLNVSVNWSREWRSENNSFMRSIKEIAEVVA